MTDAQQGVSERRLKPIRRITPERESSSDSSIYAIPGSPCGAELTEITEKKQILWKRPEPEKSNSKRKWTFTVPSPNGKFQTIRELLDEKDEPKVRKPKRLKKNRGFAQGWGSSKEHTREPAFELKNRYGNGGDHKDGNGDAPVDPAALSAMNAFSRNSQKLASGPKSRLEVWIPAKATDMAPKLPERVLVSSWQVNGTNGSVPRNSSVQGNTIESTHGRHGLPPDFSFEVPKSPPVHLLASPTTLPEETTQGQRKEGLRDPTDTSEYEFDDEPEDDYIFPHPASKGGRSSGEVRDPSDVPISPHRPNKPIVDYPILDFEGLNEIELPRHQPRSRRRANAQRQTASGAHLKVPNDTSPQQVESRRGLMFLVSLAQVQDPMSAIEVSSASLQHMRLIIGFDREEPWAIELLKNLANDSNPPALSERARKLFRYIRILKKDSERAPKAPALREQEKWLESRRSDYVQYHLSIDKLVGQIMDSPVKSSDVALTKELSYRIIPALFLALWATFMLGGTYEGEGGRLWPAAVGKFTCLALNQLALITKWIRDLLRLLSELEDEDDQLWIHRTANNCPFTYHLLEFLSSLEAPTKQLAQPASSESAAQAERKRKEDILKRETAQRAANERARQKAEIEKERIRQAMCQSTLEMREKLKLGQIQVQRALSMAIIDGPPVPSSTAVSAPEPFRPHGFSREHLRTPPSSATRPVSSEKLTVFGEQSASLRPTSIPSLPQPARLGPPYSATNIPSTGTPSSSNITSSAIWALEDQEWLAAELIHCGGKPEPSEIEGWAEILDRDVRDVEEMARML